MTSNFKFTIDSELGDETRKFLQELIQIDTTNPPGNEIRKALFLKKKFEKEGLDGEIIESEKNRGNFIFRLNGQNKNAPSLLLLSHLDVVPADPDGWKYPPFSGHFDGTFIWGRGALDCSNVTVSGCMALFQAIREGFRPRGDIIIAATADEELGGSYGVIWLLKNHPELIKADFVINEGIGIKLPLGKTPQYLIQHAEKGVYWTKLVCKGIPTHASVPYLGENALFTINQVISKLKNYKYPVIITPAFKDMLNNIRFNWIAKKLLGNKYTLGFALFLLKQMMPELAYILKALTRMTIAPTILNSGVKENIIPEKAELVLDIRALPGQDRSYVNSQLKKIIGKKLIDKIDIIPILDEPGTRTEPNDLLFKKIGEVINEIDPGAVLVPFLVPGNSDSKEFKYLEIPTYGFVPMQEDPEMPLNEALTLAHGKNERISLKNLLLSTEFMYRLIKKF